MNKKQHGCVTTRVVLTKSHPPPKHSCTVPKFVMQSFDGTIACCDDAPESADEVQLEPQMHKVWRFVPFGEAQGEHVVRILKPNGPNESRRCPKCRDLQHLVRPRVHM